MKIFKKVPEIDFLGKKKIAFLLSAILICVGLFSIFTKGFHYGIDFRGGTLVQVKFQETPPLNEIRALFKKNLNTAVTITTFGEASENEIMISISQEAISHEKDNLSEAIDKVFDGKLSNYDIRRIETVGPKVGNELKSKATQAVLYSLIGILAYIWFRFRFLYGIGAIIALFHDVMITLGIFSLLGKEISLTIVAALLTIVGYSLNDTIVVFDRVRENIPKLPKFKLEKVINISVNESLSRTLLTSITTFIVVAGLFAFGGDIIHDFAFAMLIGLVVGTYSSVFVASPAVIFIEELTDKKKK